jgi:type II secretory ATPase GspE/PulE/Tfp pilus assembly ATPase PilB-like protein
MVNQYFGKANAPDEKRDEPELLSVAQQEELVRAVTSLVGSAHRQGLSDLRIETTPGAAPGEVRFQVSGVLRLP